MSKFFSDPFSSAQLSDSEIVSSLDLLMMDEINDESKEAFLSIFSVTYFVSSDSP